MVVVWALERHAGQGQEKCGRRQVFGKRQKMGPSVHRRKRLDSMTGYEKRSGIKAIYSGTKFKKTGLRARRSGFFNGGMSAICFSGTV